MRGLFVVLALAVTPFIARVSLAQGGTHVVRHDMASPTSDTKQCEQRTRGNPSQTGADNRADPTTKGNKDCTPPVVYGHTQLQGSVFNDLNKDGTFGSDGVGLAGWTVQASGPMSASALTDVNDAYNITGLTAGTYTVCVMAPAGWTQTLPSAGSGPTCSNATVGYSIDAPQLVGDVWYSGVNFGFFSN